MGKLAALRRLLTATGRLSSQGTIYHITAGNNGSVRQLTKLSTALLARLARRLNLQDAGERPAIRLMFLVVKQIGHGPFCEKGGTNS